MSFVKSDNSDPLSSKAQSLVASANVLAISSYTVFLGQYPIIKTVKCADWDFFMTVSGVFVALSRLRQSRLQDGRVEALETIVSGLLANWNPDACAAFEDCKSFFERTHGPRKVAIDPKSDEARFASADCIGMWVAWNIFGHAPDKEDERATVRAIGGFVVHSFYSWWESQDSGRAN